MSNALLIVGVLVVVVVLVLLAGLLFTLLLMLLAWRPPGMASVFLRLRLRRLGHKWVTWVDAANLAAGLGIKAWMIPRYEDVAVLPGFGADPVRFLVGWLGSWPSS